MYCNKGTVIYLQGECVEGNMITGFDPDSTATIRDDGGILVGSETLVTVYLYRIKYIPTSGPVTYRNSLFAALDPVPVQCPVVLPPELLPESGTYEAQQLNIGFAGGPYIDPEGNPLAVNFLYGPVSWPTKPGNDHPFKVSAINETTYSVTPGAVNNSIPTNMATPVAVEGAGFIWVVIPYVDGYFNPSALVIAGGTTIPTDTDAEGYIGIASVNAGEVTQLVTGSLWANRIKVGTVTAQYFYARI